MNNLAFLTVYIIMYYSCLYPIVNCEDCSRVEEDNDKRKTISKFAARGFDAFETPLSVTDGDGKYWKQAIFNPVTPAVGKPSICTVVHSDLIVTTHVECFKKETQSETSMFQEYIQNAMRSHYEQKGIVEAVREEHSNVIGTTIRADSTEAAKYVNYAWQKMGITDDLVLNAMREEYKKTFEIVDPPKKMPDAKELRESFRGKREPITIIAAGLNPPPIHKLGSIPPIQFSIL